MSNEDRADYTYTLHNVIYPNLGFRDKNDKLAGQYYVPDVIKKSLVFVTIFFI